MLGKQVIENSGPVGRVGKRALDLLLPPQCLGCGDLVDEVGALCADCWGKITFLGAPCCAACGLPFETTPAPGCCAAAAPGNGPPIPAPAPRSATTSTAAA